jgi:penicillin amidase
VLACWDGRLDADSPGAALISEVYQEVARGLAGRLAGDLAPTVLGAGIGLIGGGSFSYRMQGQVLRALEAAGPPWFAEAADRDRFLRAAVGRASQTLRDGLGAWPQRWSWGAMHHWRLPHAMDAVPIVGRRFSRGPYPFPGDTNTLLQAGYRIVRGPDTVGVLPGYRQIIDLADLDRSVFQLSTGNSGIPGHPRYGDCIEEFRAGRYRPLLYSRAAVERHLEHTLRLEPA